jgi:hypothetical protein
MNRSGSSATSTNALRRLRRLIEVTLLQDAEGTGPTTLRLRLPGKRKPVYGAVPRSDGKAYYERRVAHARRGCSRDVSSHHHATRVRDHVARLIVTVAVIV